MALSDSQVRIMCQMQLGRYQFPLQEMFLRVMNEKKWHNCLTISFFHFLFISLIPNANYFMYDYFFQEKKCDKNGWFSIENHLFKLQFPHDCEFEKPVFKAWKCLNGMLLNGMIDFDVTNIKIAILSSSFHQIFLFFCMIQLLIWFGRSFPCFMLFSFFFSRSVRSIDIW